MPIWHLRVWPRKFYFFIVIIILILSFIFFLKKEFRYIGSFLSWSLLFASFIIPTRISIWSHFCCEYFFCIILDIKLKLHLIQIHLLSWHRFLYCENNKNGTYVQCTLVSHNTIGIHTDYCRLLLYFARDSARTYVGNSTLPHESKYLEHIRFIFVVTICE